MDLDEVYYDAGAHAGAVIVETWCDAGKKKKGKKKKQTIENEVIWGIRRIIANEGTGKSIRYAVPRGQIRPRLLSVTRNILNARTKYATDGIIFFPSCWQRRPLSPSNGAPSFNDASLPECKLFASISVPRGEVAQSFFLLEKFKFPGSGFPRFNPSHPPPAT